jgi:hypothetical protein
VISSSTLGEVGDFLLGEVGDFLLGEVGDFLLGEVGDFLLGDWATFSDWAKVGDWAGELLGDFWATSSWAGDLLGDLGELGETSPGWAGDLLGDWATGWAAFSLPWAWPFSRLLGDAVGDWATPWVGELGELGETTVSRWVGDWVGDWVGEPLGEVGDWATDWARVGDWVSELGDWATDWAKVGDWVTGWADLGDWVGESFRFTLWRIARERIDSATRSEAGVDRPRITPVHPYSIPAATFDQDTRPTPRRPPMVAGHPGDSPRIRETTRLIAPRRKVVSAPMTARWAYHPTKPPEENKAILWL